MKITKKYLRENPNHIFVFGDNFIQKGFGGAAILRGEPNTYGFITKKYPNNNDSSFFKPEEYKEIFENQLDKLIKEIENNPNKTYLISKLGGGLANRYHIFEKVICPKIFILKKYLNVKFLF